MIGLVSVVDDVKDRTGGKKLFLLLVPNGDHCPGGKCLGTWRRCGDVIGVAWRGGEGGEGGRVGGRERGREGEREGRGKR